MARGHDLENVRTTVATGVEGNLRGKERAIQSGLFCLFATAFQSGIVPISIYVVGFVSLTFPLIENFSSHYFSDSSDGLQNVWNLWWVNKALTELHQSPWFTAYLHWPAGTTLIGHTLNPFNGFLSVILSRWATLVHVHNFIVIFSFAVAGWTMFLLARHLSGQYVGSLVAGFVFTFCNFHFAHAEGHLQLVSLEWIPLFLLAWLRLLERPASIARGVMAAVALLLVLFCDYSYFFCCALAGALIFFDRRRVSDLRFGGVISFVAVASLTSGPFLARLLWVHATDRLLGAHSAAAHSLDFFGLLIPGGHWRFHQWTAWFWSSLPGNINESSVYLGFTVAAVLTIAWKRRSQALGAYTRSFALVGIVFAILALGPRLQVWGHALRWAFLPYSLLELMFPPMRMSGVPVRFTVMVALAASAFVGAEMGRLLHGDTKSRLVGSAALAVMIFEFLPRPIPQTRITSPTFVEVLAKQDPRFAYMDVKGVATPSENLYYQTLHGVPLFAGYIARWPRSIERKDDALSELARRGEFRVLCERYGFRYFLLPVTLESGIDLPPIFENGELVLYDVGVRWSCAEIPHRVVPFF